MSNNNHIDNWDLLFFKMANLIARKSKDTSSQVGSVIVKDRIPLMSGFNGFCMGVDDTEDRYSNRELKYKFVAHSEFNACILASRFGISVKDSIMYTQSTPCCECAKSIIQSGIKEVKVLVNCENIWLNSTSWSNSSELSKIMFKESGVILTFIDMVCGDTIKIGGKLYSI